MQLNLALGITNLSNELEFLRLFGQLLRSFYKKISALAMSWMLITISMGWAIEKTLNQDESYQHR